MSIALRVGVCAAIIGIALGNANSARADSLFDRILRVMGISATPSQMKGDSDVIAGQIWIAELELGRRTALTTDSGYRWPVYAPGGERGHQDDLGPFAVGGRRELETVEISMTILLVQRHQRERTYTVAHEYPETADGRLM